VLSEWKLYKNIFNDKPVIRELHLGGGTPTFFSAENLRALITQLLADTIIHEDHEFSFEGHPNNTTEEHLQTLFDLGFRRVSFGVQDLDEKVQRTINRIQPFGTLQRVTHTAREIGYNSISFDLIYGLPYQTPSTIINTFEKVLTLRPERVSFYSYAHVPWMRPGQRGYEPADLPSDVVKRLLYETGRAMLKCEGYKDIGMDHFAVPDDAMFVAQCNGKLHRNFMGYTTNDTDLLVGLGCSAISDAKYAYVQNIKSVEGYRESILNGSLPVVKGHIQTQEDLLLKKCILEIACQSSISTNNLAPVINHAIKRDLATYCNEVLLYPDKDGYKVTDTGRPFIRNICSTFDLRRKVNQTPAVRLYSKSI
jgi:oxygen-independent coproporphyrinogen-3 oxidase